MTATDKKLITVANKHTISECCSINRSRRSQRLHHCNAVSPVDLSTIELVAWLSLLVISHHRVIVRAVSGLRAVTCTILAQYRVHVVGLSLRHHGRVRRLSGPSLGWSRWIPRRRQLRHRHVALVRVVLDLQALVQRPAHHARSREERIVDGVGRDEDVSALVVDLDGDDDQIVDMLEIVTDALLVHASVCTTSNDDVSACARSDLISNVIRHVELTIIPLDSNALRADVDVLALSVGQELFSTGDEGHRCSAVITDIDVEKNAALDFGCEFRVSGALGQIREEDGPLVI